MGAGSADRRAVGDDLLVKRVWRCPHELCPTKTWTPPTGYSRDTLGHRNRTGDPLFGSRRVLRRRHDQLTTKTRARLEIGLLTGGPDGRPSSGPSAKIS